jgi:hypothetical protein
MVHGRIAALAACVWLLMLGSPAASVPPPASPDPEAEAEARRLVAILPVEEAITEAIGRQRLREAIADRMAESIPRPRGIDETGFRAHLREAIVAEIERNHDVGVAVAQDAAMMLLAYRLSAEDLRAARAFAETPSGRRTLSALLAADSLLSFEAAMRLHVQHRMPSLESEAVDRARRFRGDR